MNGESYGRDFEYDEDAEAGDEAAEAADEDVEASDEDVEADEAVDEGDEASDEGFAAAEGDEAADEAADEGDEAFGEEVGVSASAQLKTDQDRNRRAAWARRIAADQRVEAKRAATTQRSITSQIRSIQPGGTTRVYSIGRLQGAGVVTAVLPNGRRSRMRIIPTVAPISEVNRLRSVIAVNDRRQAVATGRNSRAIAALATAQSATVRKLTAEQVKSDKDLRRRIVEGDNRLDKRITKELSGGTGSLDKHGKRMMALLRRNRQRSIMNSVLLATSAPFFAAYGDRAEPFSRNNLILTGSLLGWLLGDELVDQFSSKSSSLKGGANVWSYFAPIGNGATVFFLLDKRQHERFVSGVSNVAAGVALPVDLTTTKLIAEKSADDFRKGQHLAVASIVAGDPGDVTASVANGVLTLNSVADATVAWIVDTQAI